MIWDGAQKCAFLASSREVLILFQRGPYLPCSRGRFNHLVCVCEGGSPSTIRGFLVYAMHQQQRPLRQRRQEPGAAGAAGGTARVQTARGPRGSGGLSASVEGRGLGGGGAGAARLLFAHLAPAPEADTAERRGSRSAGEKEGVSLSRPRRLPPPLPVTLSSPPPNDFTCSKDGLQGFSVPGLLLSGLPPKSAVSAGGEENHAAQTHLQNAQNANFGASKCKTAKDLPIFLNCFTFKI